MIDGADRLKMRMMETIHTTSPVPSNGIHTEYIHKSTYMPREGNKTDRQTDRQTERCDEEKKRH